MLFFLLHMYELSINVLVGSFHFIWIFMLWVYSHYKYFIPAVWGSTFRRQNWHLRSILKLRYKCSQRIYVLKVHLSVTTDWLWHDWLLERSKRELSRSIHRHCPRLERRYRAFKSYVSYLSKLKFSENSGNLACKMKWNESSFRPPLCTYRLNWARRTSWGWWDDWDDTVLQTQDSKFEPWRSEAEHATSRSRRLPTILTFTRGWGRNNFVSFKPPRPGTEPRTLAWKAAVLTTTLGPPPILLVELFNLLMCVPIKCIECGINCDWLAKKIYLLAEWNKPFSMASPTDFSVEKN